MGGSSLVAATSVSRVAEVMLPIIMALVLSLAPTSTILSDLVLGQPISISPSERALLVVVAPPVHHSSVSSRVW